MNTFKQTSMSFIVTLGLVGCGGGGGGGSASAPTPTPVSPAPSAIEVTTDLVAPNDFSYDPRQEATLNVDLSSSFNQKAYLSVYRVYDESAQGILAPDYGSRIVAMPLKDGKATAQITLAQSDETLLAEVWFYDGSEPLQLELDAQQSEWYW
ncbi:hypothetical protein [Vibrio sp. SCSIO 43136]|uniref:hypothetical protein n=1 Tax=Vibrio sp. SCSIO 43136 TaxID=2819101 RepID=UPI0020752280|nr:hypothetical protein [Vibrio sp. SCSIO 43136]USD67857.1 hypothetical protein J4N39_16870 [Vibrio sp. SCSIO 43136]